MKRYDILLWDVDQTLLDFDRSMEDALRYTFQHFGLTITDEIIKQYAEINHSYWKRLELGEITKQELLIGRFRTLLDKLSLNNRITAQEMQPVYQKALGSVYYFLDDSFSLCQKLNGQIRQFIVSNGVTETQTNKLKLSGLWELMEDIFISENIGYEKPSPLFFEECFRKIPNFCKERTLIVGDSLTSDIKGANTVGLDCCWYNPKHLAANTKLKINYEISNLWEVEKIL